MNPTQHQPTRADEAAEFCNGLGFHPANTERIQLAHEAVRLLAQLMGTHLVSLLPNGRDKSLAKTHLEDVMMRANRAIALGKGPHPLVDDERLAALVASTKRILTNLGVQLASDPRIEKYKAEQRGETFPPTADRDVVAKVEAFLDGATKSAEATRAALEPQMPFEYRTGEDGSMVRSLAASMVATPGPKPEFLVAVGEHDEGENYSQRSDVYIDDPEVLDAFAAYLVRAANQLRALQARNIQDKNHGEQLLREE